MEKETARKLLNSLNVEEEESGETKKAKQKRDDEYGKLKLDLRKCESYVRALEGREGEWAKQVTDLETNNANLTGDITKIKNKTASLESANSTLREEIESMRTASERLRREKSELAKALEAKTRELAERPERVVEHEKTVEKIVERIVETSSWLHFKQDLGENLRTIVAIVGVIVTLAVLDITMRFWLPFLLSLFK